MGFERPARLMDHVYAALLTGALVRALEGWEQP